MAYAWPAAAVTEKEMAILHAVRERTRPKIPITELIAHAIRETYCGAPVSVSETIQRLNPGAAYTPEPPKEAA